MRRHVPISILPAKANIQHNDNVKATKEIMDACHDRIKIYLVPSMVHGKLMIIDGCTVTFGSANLNNIAMNMLCELKVLFRGRDKDIVIRFSADFEEKKAEAVQVSHGAGLRYNRMFGMIEQVFF